MQEVLFAYYSSLLGKIIGVYVENKIPYFKTF